MPRHHVGSAEEAAQEEGGGKEAAAGKEERQERAQEEVRPETRCTLELLEHGYSICDGFLDAGLVRALCECAGTRRARGDFSAGRIGADQAVQRRPDIRGDTICWLEEPLAAPELELLRRIDRLRLRLNECAYLGLFDVEMHYAWYPPGAGYARHVDQPRGREQRQVSLIVYLNQEWTPEDAGQLRLYAADGAVQIDVDPVAGRLVLFLTGGREHSVLPNRHGRLSISGWFRLRQP